MFNNKNYIIPLLALGLYCQCNNVNMANNTTMIVIILALIIKKDNDDNNDTGTVITQSNTPNYHNGTPVIYQQGGYPYPYYVNTHNNNCGCGCGYVSAQPYNVGYAPNVYYQNSGRCGCGTTIY